MHPHMLLQFLLEHSMNLKILITQIRVYFFLVPVYLFCQKQTGNQTVNKYCILKTFLPLDFMGEYYKLLILTYFISLMLDK